MLIDALHVQMYDWSYKLIRWEECYFNLWSVAFDRKKVVAATCEYFEDYQVIFHEGWTEALFMASLIVLIDYKWEQHLASEYLEA